MNVLIIGAGASYATHEVPIARAVLREWEPTIRDLHKLLAFALEVWIGAQWPDEDLETAWTKVDAVWKERSAGTSRFAVSDLTNPQRRKVWQLAFESEAAESREPNYYRSQLEWALDLGHSAEAFLSVVAGWELRRLIQSKLTIPVRRDYCRPYERVRDELQPTAVISFNYDTLIERFLEPGTWTYSPLPAGSDLTSILKPHGSVNWTHRLPLIRGPAEQVHFDTTLPPERMGYQRNWFVQNLIVGLRVKIEHTLAEQSPIILTVFRDILRACEGVLVEADKIWIVGYRFAPADTSFLEVIARSIARRMKPPSLSVIDHGNPQERLPRIRDLFGLPDGAHIPCCFCGFKKWAEHGFCLP